MCISQDNQIGIISYILIINMVAVIINVSIMHFNINMQM